MLKFRKEFPAFGFDAEMEIRTKPAAQISTQAENALHFAKYRMSRCITAFISPGKRTGILPVCQQT